MVELHREKGLYLRYAPNKGCFSRPSRYTSAKQSRRAIAPGCVGAVYRV
jgi:hypothetical protein